MKRLKKQLTDASKKNINKKVKNNSVFTQPSSYNNSAFPSPPSPGFDQNWSRDRTNVISSGLISMNDRNQNEMITPESCYFTSSTSQSNLSPTCSLPSNKNSNILQHDLNPSSSHTTTELPSGEEGRTSQFGAKCIDTFKSHLNSWVVDNNISRNSYSKLLRILKNDLNLDICCDSRTLLKTTSIKTGFLEMSSGTYYRFDLEESIIFLLKKASYVISNNISNILKLEINIDGLPLVKSSCSQFWPILGNLENIKPDSVFPIGVFHGYKKPEDLNEYLKYFVDDFLRLKNDGIIFNGITLQLELTKIMCDAPAKAFILGVKNHNAYSSCTKCITEGTFVSNRMTFPDLNANIRTDESVRNLTDEDYHRTCPLSLLKLDIGLVSQVPLDYMHLICLGVMKKLLTFWVKGNRSVRLFDTNITEIDKNIIKYRNQSVIEFVRKPRSIKDIDRWKATEFRQFLLYYGPILLKTHLNKNMYLHFLCLHCAIRILATPELCIKYNAFAQTLLRHFVEHFGDFYGIEHVNHNVHNLIHICDDVLKFGCLDNFSCFKFENYMNIILNTIKVTKFPLKQFVNRVLEKKEFSVLDKKVEQQLSKPLCFKNINNDTVMTYQQVIYKQFVIRIKEPNCFLVLEGNLPAKVINIFKLNGQIYIEYISYTILQNCFTEPCPSSIFSCGLIGNTGSTDIALLSKIKSKAIKLDNIFLSLLH